MTGWRIGYAAGNALIIKAMTDLASHSTSNPTTPSQYGAIAAYNGTQEPVETMRDAFEDRLNKIHQQLIQIPGVSCLKPQGAFYLFPNVIEAAKLTGFDSVDQFAEALLEEAKRCSHSGFRLWSSRLYSFILCDIIRIIRKKQLKEFNSL